MDVATAISIAINSKAQAKDWQNVAIKIDDDPELKHQFITALWLFKYDYDLIEDAVITHHDKKFAGLFDALPAYIMKYKKPSLAFNALGMKLLYYSRGNVEQSNRIIHRSNLYKERSKYLTWNWDARYGMALIKKNNNSSIRTVTKGEAFLDSLKAKMGLLAAGSKS